MTFSKIALVGSVVLAFAGCSESSRKDIRETARNYELDSGLQDTFQSECRGIDLGVAEASQTTSYYFNLNNFEHRVAFYDDSSCSDAGAEITYAGDFELSNVEGKDHNNIDLEYQSATVSILSEDMAELFNEGNFCGKGDWSPGDEVEFKDLDPALNCPLFEVPSTHFDIIDRESEQIYFGSGITGAATSENERPTEINTDISYSK